MSNSELLYRGRFLELVKDGRWEYVRRVGARGAVFVLATTDRNELILVEQRRVPLQARCIELPAGILGDEAAHRDESPETCALRELLEETGYQGREATVIMRGPVAPGLTSERLFLVQVSGIQQVHAGGGVDGEDIQVHSVPLGDIDAWLNERERDGLVIEPRIYAGLYFLKKSL